MPAARRQPAVGGRIILRRAAFLLLSGLILAAPGASTAYAQQAPAERPSRSDPFGAFIAEAAQRFGVPEAWIRAVMRAESAGDVRAISPAGAMGLMQIMPATWADLRVRHRLGGNPYDPRDNILAGAAYLREMHDRYGSPGFLAAYNAGPGRYEEYLAGRPLPAETRAYVATLAPVVGGGELVGPVTVAAADPLAWTRAPLFVVQSSGRASAVPLQTEREPDATTAAAPERDEGPVAALTDGLFVARNVPGGPR
ncbi:MULTISPECIES: lytic transglycosylase domain-containing protein [Alphaproteobacteria]|jgi:soluble lytic murein transglycosylase-like protein|uniref:Lytic transglycosylase domain-containing protein n=3 Tax=Pseudomonadota TaxID=1224 RepID=A0A327ME66_9PROT|nr:MULTISPECIES: lytic transglycosylase domain-containing protein [Alphaproteobacteria]RAI60686.1 lytic transglycosylase domain-containing protein [Roseicella frigidaeris]